MEPADLTCAKCGTTWKLIKAGEEPVTCPNCSHPVGGPSAPAPTTVLTTGGQQGGPRPQAAVPAGALDVDDPSLGAPPARFVEPAPRRRSNPLLTVAIALMLLLMVPAALVIMLFAVCAYSLH